MTQDPVALEDNVGYVLKQASTALHVAMETALRPCGLTLSQYSCLELLRRTPDQTNAQLARGAFVTAQSMNEMLRTLEDRGLVVRPDTAPAGRARPTRLTPAGRRAVADANEALAPVDAAMSALAAHPDHAHLLTSLRAVITTLTP